MADDATHDDTPKGQIAPDEEARGVPTALLLFPLHALPPDDWHATWVKAGWSVLACNHASEVSDALADPRGTTLFALPWPGSGEMASARALVDELQFTVTALGVPQDVADAGIQAGFMRRGAFLARLAATMRTPDRQGCCALLAIRVDRFDAIVSRLDRTAIFDLEENLARRFASELRKEDAYAIWLEFGFGVLVSREHADEVHDLARRICACVADRPFEAGGEACQLTVSVGVALPPRGYAGADRWFAVAHAAQAIALRHGGNRHEGLLTRSYEPMPAERVMIVREWVEEAKTGNNMLVEYQPLLQLQRDAAHMYSVHAKLRDYRDPLGGVYRGEYLRLAREAGAMVMIDRVGLFRAFEALEQERAHGRDTRLLVAVEYDTFEGNAGLWLAAELRRRRHLAYGLVLKLEGSERLLAPECVPRLQELHALGVGLAVHDRSGDLEQLQHWSRLPVELLLLPAAVVEAIAPDEFGKALASWREQGRKVVVDGVDRMAEMPAFARLGVDYLRGPGVAAIGPRLDFDFG